MIVWRAVAAGSDSVRRDQALTVRSRGAHGELRVWCRVLDRMDSKSGCGLMVKDYDDKDLCVCLGRDTSRLWLDKGLAL